MLWEKMLVINLFFVLGFVLKKLRIFKEEDGNVVLKMAFYIFLPAILFQSIRKVDFTFAYLLYPLIMLISQLIMSFFTAMFLKNKNMDEGHKKIIVGFFGAANIGFLYPFYISIFGEQNVWRLGLLDFGNSIFLYAIVYSYIVGAKKKKETLRKIFLSPGIMALILSLLVNFFHIEIYAPIDIFISQLAGLTGFAMLFSLGIFFNFKMSEIKKSGKIVMAKEAVKILLLVLVYHLNLEYYTKAAIMLVIIAPAASSLLNFALFAKLDTKFASKLVSLSMVMAFIEIPIVMYFLQKLSRS